MAGLLARALTLPGGPHNRPPSMAGWHSGAQGGPWGGWVTGLSPLDVRGPHEDRGLGPQESLQDRGLGWGQVRIQVRTEGAGFWWGARGAGTSTVATSLSSRCPPGPVMWKPSPGSLPPFWSCTASRVLWSCLRAATVRLTALEARADTPGGPGLGSDTTSAGLMGCLPISLLTQLCPRQPQGGTLLLDLPSELNHSWISSAASNVSRKGVGPLESDRASLDSGL